MCSLLHIQRTRCTHGFEDVGWHCLGRLEGCRWLHLPGERLWPCQEFQIAKRMLLLRKAGQDQVSSSLTRLYVQTVVCRYPEEYQRRRQEDEEHQAGLKLARKGKSFMQCCCPEQQTTSA